MDEKIIEQDFVYNPGKEWKKRGFSFISSYNFNTGVLKVIRTDDVNKRERWIYSKVYSEMDVIRKKSELLEKLGFFD